MFRPAVCLCIFCPCAGLVLGLSLLTARHQPAAATGPGPSPLEAGFQKTVQPFLKTYCSECHSGTQPKGDLDLSVFASVDAIAKDLRRWEMVLKQLETETMPPKKAKQHPTPEARKEIISWIRDFRKDVAKRNAGDPGPMAARRLSNAEYDYTIRDLTGADIRPAQEFPVDPTNEAGFDNSAESLMMSSALFNKYIEAARRVSEHVVLAPDRLEFAEYPVVADTDRDKFCTRRIIDFYKQQRTDYADYFQAAWQYQHRAALSQPKVSLAEIASAAGVSGKYLTTVWGVLTGPPEEEGPIAALRNLWKELPAPKQNSEAMAVPTDVRAGCVRMRDFVVRLREKLVPEVKNLTSRPMHNGTQPLVMWKNREMAANRMRYAGGALKMQLEKLAPAAGTVGEQTAEAARLALTAPADADALKVYESGLAKFCAAFPDAFLVSERARVYLDPKGEQKLTGRLLNAGFHSMTGYYRDDSPLYELVLSEEQQKELDQLWLEFNTVTGAPMRMHTSLIWFERSDSSYMRSKEFDFCRAEDKDCTSEEKIKKLSDLWVAKARKNNASEVAIKACQDHFEITNANVRLVEKTRLAAEPIHVKDLQAFAERAYRRPLTKTERDDVAAFYHRLRDKEGLSHEEAVRDVITSVLVSPHFLFRVDVASAANPPAPAAEGVKRVKWEPLSDVALASRLSYFLWSSMPDAELLARAAAGDLHRPDVLIAQSRRMVKDKRFRGMATEFAGNWLDIRRFEEHNAVDRERFKSFTDDLRRAMFEEPLQYFLDVARTDRSVLDFIYGKHTFVNPTLARHYGMPAPSAPTMAAPKGKKNAPVPVVVPEKWELVENASEYGRGGLLPMAVFLTKNAPGLRTSPVKRGNWVVRKLLGETIPAPPAEVPELPQDESKLDLPLRDLLARHRADKSCSGCHERFDSIGLTFEGYGPIGELRTKDLAGRLVDAHATFPGGGEGTGLDGLLKYLRDRRQDEFVENLCRKLLAFGLGRTLLPSDDELVDDMRQRLAANGYRFGTLIEGIITSSQFLNRRVN